MKTLKATLIICPGCQKDVSKMAAACPHCGHPLAATTIEQTAKKWKGIQLLSLFMIVVGFIGSQLTQVPEPTSFSILGLTKYWVLIVVAGISLFFISRLGAWWHHG